MYQSIYLFRSSDDRWEQDYEDHNQQDYQENHYAPNIKGTPLLLKKTHQI